MAKPLLFLPKGSYDKDKWEKANRRDSLRVIPNDPGEHKEKALAVSANIRGQSYLIPGLGEMWTEDLKDLAERIAEEEDANAEANAIAARERAEAQRIKWQEYFDAKIQAFKRNSVTMKKAAYRTQEQEKTIF